MKGPSMVKWTTKVLKVPKTIVLYLVKHLEVVAKWCINWILLHGDHYCCVKHPYVEYQDEIFKIIYFKSNAQKQILTITCPISLLAHPLAASPKIHRLCFWDCFSLHELLGFVNQYVQKMFMIFSFVILKLVDSFESFSLKRVQESRVVHLTVVAPRNIWCSYY